MGNLFYQYGQWAHTRKDIVHNNYLLVAEGACLCPYDLCTNSGNNLVHHVRADAHHVHLNSILSLKSTIVVIYCRIFFSE